MSKTLVLASTSSYRRKLLQRLSLPFSSVAPRAVETPLFGESPEALVRRLAKAKALSVAADFPDAIIIGSDQVAVLDGQIIGKPGNFAVAHEQLRRASGREVLFLTGVCCHQTSATAVCLPFQEDVIAFRVVFRPLTEDLIQRYLERDKPFDCAGSFKSEGLGIVLFERMVGDDPTSLVGLPLITVCRMLENIGLHIPPHAAANDSADLSHTHGID